MYISLCCPIPIESPFSHAGIWSFETSKGSHPLKSESRFHCEKFHVESLLLEKALKQLICLAEKSPILAGTSPIFNRKYIFTNGGFSIAILVFTEVRESTKSLGVFSRSSNMYLPGDGLVMAVPL